MSFAPTAVAQAVTSREIGRTVRSTTIKVHAGTALLSRWDGTTFRLATSTAAGRLTDLPVMPQGVPFDADIGPGPDGRPAVVYSTCSRASSCSLRLLAIGDAAPHVLAWTHAAKHRETLPTIWRDRVAFVRSGSAAAGGRPHVVDLSNGRTTALAGRGPETSEISALELSGDRLGLVAVDSDADIGICGEGVVRLVRVSDRTATSVARTFCGLRGQRFLGLGFDKAHFYWAQTCNSGVGRCGKRPFGLFRRRISSGRTEHAATPGESLVGLGYDRNGHAYVVDDPWQQCTGNPADDGLCRVARLDGLRFRP